MAAVHLKTCQTTNSLYSAKADCYLICVKCLLIYSNQTKTLRLSAI